MKKLYRKLMDADPLYQTLWAYLLTLGCLLATLSLQACSDAWAEVDIKAFQVGDSVGVVVSWTAPQPHPDHA